VKEVKNDYVFGKGGRVKSPPHPLLINSAYKHDCTYAKYLMDSLHKVDLAYALMLYKIGIIPEEEIKVLLKGLLDIEKVNFENYVDPKYGDIYNGKEVYLTNIVGNAAGWLHIGRPRREAINLAYLISIRSLYLDFMKEILNLATVMYKKAQEELTTLMSDFTYLQHANPTTFGHYILTFLFPLLRDCDRIIAAYSRINSSPAGSGSVNGSSIPLDRQYLADIMCFEQVTTHARDGMWQADMPIEIMSILNMVFANLNRFTDELQMWNSQEFSLINLPDSLCRTSVIMPQKKNPYPLAYFRGLTNSFLGKLTSSVSYGKVFSGNPDSRIFAYIDIPESLELSIEVIPLISKVIEEMEINKDIALKSVNSDYSFSSELAEFLSVNYKIDYKTSHKIIGNIVSRLISGELSEMTKLDLEKTISKFLDKHIEIDFDQILFVIQPKNIIRNRKTSGGSSESEMNKMLKGIKIKIDSHTKWVEDKMSQIQFEDLYKEASNT